ncbi:MAG: hypothetical protein V2I97_09605 [Desulfococcaceae bacterium]|jgi:hypothetical protein|nr:hypothetical protein [Desulfococcaceae bacterium]
MMQETKQTQIFEQISDFQKNAMDTSYKNMEMMQDRVEKMADLFFEQSLWFSEKWENAIKNWNRSCQEGCESMTKTAMERFTKIGFPYLS